jgi:hypothetical protein
MRLFWETGVPQDEIEIPDAIKRIFAAIDPCFRLECSQLELATR